MVEVQITRAAEVREGEDGGRAERGREVRRRCGEERSWRRAMSEFGGDESGCTKERREEWRKRRTGGRRGGDKGDSSSKIKRGYTGGGGGGRRVIEEEEEEGRGYRGDVRNINRGSGLPAGAHSAPNTYCHSD